MLRIHHSALCIAVGAQGDHVVGNTLAHPHYRWLWAGNVDLWVARVTTGGTFDTSFNGNGKRSEAIDISESDKNDLIADLRRRWMSGLHGHTPPSIRV